ncbi:hypothetical protein AB3U43_01595 (plasmid) [Bacillus cereus]|uniref:Branched-chain amino acid ABC transporter substrate-binding protein n=3 Tax=Bacillus cereus group TaxID=86661 RepID=A0A9X0MID9_BACCE|nr:MULTISPECIES: hypothetical protein [Bacillus cereus group]KXY48322.1 hypothetical protein AT268_25970 [Bacillus cereus]MBU4643143.1 hypothetical protein [Bacillus toyonensis]MEC2873265.1 hypothetical protein [Bacillus cereus]OTZ79751.1 hypothetical protein BK769_00620 [Bacillus thuringiensis serovar kumamtoensis]OUB29100.1 hypothetical protein BK739_11695 [Bacillus thuringiensis serovar pirenaica]
MKKITDERLILRNLKNIKITYIVQTIGILSILGYDFFQGGLDRMRENPLWMVFILTSIVSAYLSMSISVEQERAIINPQKSFIIRLVVLAVIVVFIAYLISITPNYGWKDGLLLGSILLICGFIPMYYVYRLRLKQRQDLQDE